MTSAERKKAIEEWKAHCQRVQSLTAVDVSVVETPAERERRKKRLLANYDEFCEYYFPHWLTLYDKETGEPLRIVRNAKFHNDAVRKIMRTPNLKAVFKWARGHAKSTHLDVFTPLFMRFQEHPLVHTMVIVGKSEDSAQTLLGDLQAELENNARLIADFGEQKNVGSWEEGKFVTQDGFACFALGRGQSPRGLRKSASRPDYIVIDDLDDDELCRNPRRVRELTEWVKEALFGALDVGRGRFIMVGNLISKTSVLAEIAKTKGVYVSEVKAVDKEGNPVWADKWTREEAEAMREFMGYRSWEKEMMHNPITEGTIFKDTWIQYKRILPLHKYEEIVCYTDPSFKATTSNDYKACRTWGRTRSGELHLIECWVRQDTVSAMVRYLYDLYERNLQKGECAIKFYMEANFMQDTILDEFDAEALERGYHLPLMPDKRKKPDKLERITAISPLWERGKVFYNLALKDNIDMQTGIEQTLALEKGSKAHDDAPDADEGAIFILQKSARVQAFEPVMGKRTVPKNCW